MRALIDTCIVIDVLQDRQPFASDAQLIFLAAANKRFDGFLTANCVTDIYYLTHRKTHSDAETRRILNKLLYLFDLLDTTAMDCRHALLSSITDFEDAVMVESAVRCGMECIVTRNVRDYEKSPLHVCTPAEILQQITSSDKDFLE